MQKSMLGKLPLSEIQRPRDELERRLAGEDGPGWLAEFKKFLRQEECWIGEEKGGADRAVFAQADSGLLRLLASVPLPATDGRETIAQASAIFPGCIDPDFHGWGLDKPGNPTPETKTEVYALVEDASLQTMFGNFQRDLNQLCWQQSQIVQFCRRSRYAHWLHPEGRATFFLFRQGSEFFVADVYRHNCALGVSLYLLAEEDVVWHGIYHLRLVVPACPA